MWLLLVSVCVGLAAASCNYVNTEEVFDSQKACVEIGEAAQKALGSAKIDYFRCIKVH